MSQPQRPYPGTLLAQMTAIRDTVLALLDGIAKAWRLYWVLDRLEAALRRRWHD